MAQTLGQPCGFQVPGEPSRPVASAGGLCHWPGLLYTTLGLAGAAAAAMAAAAARVLADSRHKARLVFTLGRRDQPRAARAFSRRPVCFVWRITYEMHRGARKWPQPVLEFALQGS